MFESNLVGIKSSELREGLEQFFKYRELEVCKSLFGFRNDKELGKGIEQDFNKYLLNECENGRFERLGFVRLCGGNEGDEVRGSSNQIMKGFVGYNKKF